MITYEMEKVGSFERLVNGQLTPKFKALSGMIELLSKTNQYQPCQLHSFGAIVDLCVTDERLRSKYPELISEWAEPLCRLTLI
ncbi:hypothetical protein Ddc_18017 [Ditylenchus destructor]|nr:hypothetical protein Ddc_18017 [Ditylenchus destructor]